MPKVRSGRRRAGGRGARAPLEGPGADASSSSAFFVHVPPGRSAQGQCYAANEDADNPLFKEDNFRMYCLK